MKLVYINIGKSSVFESQVLALLNYYKENNIFDDVILLFGYQREEDKKWLMDKNNGLLTIHFFKIYPNYLFYNYKNQRSLFDVLSKMDDSFHDYFFHIRTELASYIFKKSAKKLGIKLSQVLTDVRGASAQEVKEFYSTKPLLKPFKLINYQFALRSLKKDKNISVVSNSLKEYLLSALKINENIIRVNPCLISEEFFYDEKKRAFYRNKMLLKNTDILLVFTSGGVAKWQNNEMIIELAKIGFKVLNLSRIKIKHPNIINKFVPYSEVPGYLSAGDISFIWRDKSIVNKVASPVKVSEYISCGLPIIHNGTVDMIANLLTDLSESLKIDDIKDLNFNKVLKLIEQSDREKLCQKGLLNFGLKNIGKGYQKIYEQAFI